MQQRTESFRGEAQRPADLAVVHSATSKGMRVVTGAVVVAVVAALAALGVALWAVQKVPAVGPQGPRGVQGPEGLQGARGPAGVAGPTGKAGAAGTVKAGKVVSGSTLVSAPDPVIGTVLVAKTSCPAGKVLMGGGAQVWANGVLADRNVSLRSSFPLNSSTWKAVAITSGPLGTGTSMNLKPFVLCGSS